MQVRLVPWFVDCFIYSWNMRGFRDTIMSRDKVPSLKSIASCRHREGYIHYYTVWHHCDSVTETLLWRCSAEAPNPGSSEKTSRGVDSKMKLKYK